MQNVKSSGNSYLVKLLLQFLISIINAKLLKTVNLKQLKAIDIKNAYIVGSFLLATAQRRVDVLHNP